MSRGAHSRWDVLLVHAVRSWDAEVINAERLAARVNLVITIILAVAGVGLFKVVLDPFASPLKPYVLNAALAAGNVMGLAFLAVAFLMLMGILRGRPGPAAAATEEGPHPQPTASFFLLPEQSLLEELKGSEPSNRDHPDYFTYRSFLRTTKAALDLASRNWDEKRRIDRGQQWFLIGLFLLLLSSLLYTGAKGSP